MTMLEHFTTEHWVGGSDVWGLQMGRDRRDGSRVLIARTAPHVESIETIAARFAPNADGPVLAIGREQRADQSIDVLIEQLPVGRPSTEMSIAEAAQRRLLAAAAESLAPLHARGLIVGSLRPELIYVDETGTLTGVAPYSELFYRDLAPTSTAKRYPFDELYMAPELIRVEPVGPAADVFCLAGCLARWHFGRYPFAGETFLERVVSLASGALANDLDASTLPPIVQQSLASSPADRPTLADLIAKL